MDTNCIIKCGDLDPNAFGLTAGGQVTLNGMLPGQTPNTSPSNTILTTGTSGHTLDINVPDKTTACQGDVIPADAVAQYNPVHKAPDGTLWTRAPVGDHSAIGSAVSNVPFAFNIPMPVGYTLGDAVATLTITNPSNCKPMKGIWTLNEINYQAIGEDGKTFDITVTVNITTTSAAMPVLNYARNTSVTNYITDAPDSATQHESTRQYILDDIPPGGSQTFSVSTSTSVDGGTVMASQYIYNQITYIGHTY